MTRLSAPIGLLAALALSLALCPAFAFAAEGSSAALSAGSSTDVATTQELTTQAKIKIPSAKATKYYTTPKRDYSGQSASTTVSGITFESYKSSSSNASYDHTLTVTYKNSTYFVDSNVRSFATNGRFLVYAKGVKPVTITSSYGHSYNTYYAGIYRLDLATGAKKKVSGGNDWTVFSANSSYVYCGAAGTSVTPGNLYAVKVKNSAKKKLRKGAITQVVCSNSNVMFTTMRQQICCSTLYTCKANGANKKSVASKVGGIRLKGNRVLYMQGNSKLTSFRLVSCKFSGGDRKTVVNWQSSFTAFQDKYGISG